MRSRYKVTQKNGIYFITSTIIEWLPIFTTAEYFDILIDSFKFCHTTKSLKIYAYTILDNHFHALCSAPELSKTIQSLKSFTGKQIVNQLQQDNKNWVLRIFKYQKKYNKTDSKHQIWQEGFHPELIQNEKMLVQKINYIHQNIIKRGVVTEAEHWRYSSAAYFSGHPDTLMQMDPLPI